MKKILVVDDDKNIVSSLQDILEIHGYAVIAETDGAAAFKKMEIEHPDLVISDIMMPGLDGAALLSEVDLSRSVTGTPIIFISGMVKKESDKNPTSSRKNVYYLPKPFEVEELLSLVKKILS